ncbi:MAG TPA: FmdB family transcriptional regulator [Acidobacteriota bacterium]|nr:FmdB family transcriptional regulator [Acidobacteriota bacterium]
MPIYEYYSPDTHKIYSFYAKTLAQGKLIPRCPDNPKARMVKLLSSFAVGGTKQKTEDSGQRTEPNGGDAAEDARMEAAMSAMEREFSSVDENDPRAMARMMRRMAELSGEKLDEPMEEAVRKLEEGADPDSLEEQMGDAFDPDDGGNGDPYGDGPMPGADRQPEPKEGRAKFKVRRAPPVRDPQLYDYE